MADDTAGTTGIANREQARYWTEEAGPVWVELQERFDAVLEPFGDLAVEAAGLAPGETVLDVGCGCGGSTLDLARRTGPSGRVVGLDLSAVMLDRARARVAAAGLANVDLRLADAEVAPLPEAGHDLVFSRFGLMFFGDPARAFANLRRSLRPGGRLATVTWQVPDRNPWLAEPLRALAGVLELPPPPGPGDPSPFSLADPSRVRELLAGAGFAGVALEDASAPVRLAAAEGEELADLVVRMGPGRSAYAAADPEARRRARAAVEAALGPYREGRGVRVPSAVWVVTARV
jgi:SAM-dependent methyltransferase